MYTNGFFGIPTPSGLRKLSGAENIPQAENIERTMYWLDRVAEQHGWTQDYSTDPIMKPSGFHWKRHNGLELESFEPVDSGNFRLKGYPISSQDFWNNFRQIIVWAGNKVLRKWDEYGGQVSGLDGHVNSSGNNWNYTIETGNYYRENDDNWITYGNYEDNIIVGGDIYNSEPILNNSGENSFVDFNKSSSTEYIGRHGKISRNDYNQYIPFPRVSRPLFAFDYHDMKNVGVNKFLLKRNFNTVNGDFEISRNEILTPSDFSEVQQLVSDIWYASGIGSARLQPSGFNISPDLYLSSNGGYLSPFTANYFINGYSITRKQAIGGAVVLEEPVPSSWYLRTSIVQSPGLSTDFCSPYIESVSGHGKVDTVRVPGSQLVIGSLPISPRTEGDVIDYTISDDGTLLSYNVITVKDRYIRGETREVEGISAFVARTRVGCFFPMSTKYYSAISGDRYYDNNNYKMRTFTGLTPNDSLELRSDIANIGSDGHISGIYNLFNYHKTYNYDHDQTGNNWQPRTGYGLMCSGNRDIVSHSSILNNFSNYPIDINNTYNLKLVYGFVNYEPVSGITTDIFKETVRASVNELINQSIDSVQYNKLADISMVSGYTSISILDIDTVVRPFIPILPYPSKTDGLLISPLGYGSTTEGFLSGPRYTNNRLDSVVSLNGTSFSIPYFSNPIHAVSHEMGSISGVVDINPTGNILYFAIINDDDILGNFMSETIPQLNEIDKQNIIDINETYHFRTPYSPPSYYEDGGGPSFPYPVRFVGEIGGSVNYSVRECITVYENEYDFDTNNYGRMTELRAWGHKENLNICSMSPDGSLTGDLSWPSGRGRHTSYGAVQNGQDKYRNSLLNLMTLFSDTTFYR